MLAFLSFLISLTVLAAFTGPTVGLMYFMVQNELGPNRKFYHGTGMPVLYGVIAVYIVIPVLMYLVSLGQ